MSSEYSALIEEDIDLFNVYRNEIFKKLREKFPNVASTEQLMPMAIQRQIACGIFYEYKTCLSDGRMFSVRFHLGGKRAAPLVGPPHFEIDEILQEN